MYTSIVTALSLISATVLAQSPSAASTVQPCAQISASAVSQAKATPDATAVSVPADLAKRCLNSAPFKSGPAVDLIKSLRPLLQFQSTIGYLKNPQAVQPNYPYPPVDVLNSLDELEGLAKANRFPSEAAFELAVFDLLIATKDGHVGWTPQLADVFSFARPLTLVSLSKDGLALPQVYSLGDLASNTSYTPSAITKINGQSAYDYLLDESTATGSNQDLDTNYEQEFFGWTTGRYSGGTFSGGKYWDFDSETILTFANGTTKNYTNIASSSSDWTGVVDGQSFYNSFATPNNPIAAANSDDEDSPPAALLDDFPDPVVTDDKGAVGAYLPKDKGLEDVCVLSVNSFEASLMPFSLAVQQSLTVFAQSGRSKLIIDVSGNGGGNIVLGQDLFAQLFPDLTLYAAANMRSHQAANQLGDFATSAFRGMPLQQQLAIQADNNNTLNAVAMQAFRADRDYKLDGSDVYPSWGSVAGPEVRQADALSETWLANPYTDALQGVTFNLTGTGNRTQTNLTRPFKAENIAILSDGYCGSTCSIFSGAVKNQAGVRSIAIGGTPQAGPMQAVGAVKGSQVWGFALLSQEILSMANLSLNTLPTKYSTINVTSAADFAGIFPQSFYQRYNGTAVGDLASTFLYALARASTKVIGTAGVNGQNSIRKGDKQSIPSQFVYEAADCRLFTTLPMVKNVTGIWTAAANSMFRGGQCVAGSTNHPSSVTGGNNGLGVSPDSPIARPQIGKPAGYNSTSKPGASGVPQMSGLTSSLSAASKSASTMTVSPVPASSGASSKPASSVPGSSGVASKPASSASAPAQAAAPSSLVTSVVSSKLASSVAPASVAGTSSASRY